MQYFQNEVTSPLDRELSINYSIKSNNNNSINNYDITENIDIAFLFSSPLVAGDTPIDAISLELDRKTLHDCLDESKREVYVRFEFSTIENLRTIITKRTRVLHYSGHATAEQGLAFEDGMGGLHRHFSVSKLKSLFQAGDTKGVELCFVAACHSEYVGQCFVSAGVKHVVSVQCARPKENPLSPTEGGSKLKDYDENDGRVTDRAARVFANAFYLALLLGNTVLNSFEIGKARVMADVSFIAAQDSNKFLLLPRDSNHDIVLFPNTQLGSWIDVTTKLPSCIPVPEEKYIGRNLDMSNLIKTILSRRVSIVRGLVGVGKTSLCIHTSIYLCDRKHFPVYFIRASDFSSIPFLCENILRITNIDLKPNFNILNLPEILSILSAKLKTISDDSKPRKEVLLVLDGIDVFFTNTINASDFRLLLTHLITNTMGIRLLLTSNCSIGNIPGVSPGVYSITPLSNSDAFKLFCLISPRKINVQEISESFVDFNISPPQLIRSTLNQFTLLSHPVFLALGGIPQAILLVACLMEEFTFTQLYQFMVERSIGVFLNPFPSQIVKSFRKPVDDTFNSILINLKSLLAQYNTTSPKIMSQTIVQIESVTSESADDLNQIELSMLLDQNYQDQSNVQTNKRFTISDTDHPVQLSQADTLLSLGKLKMQMGNSGESFTYLSDARELYRSYGDDLGEAEALQLQVEYNVHGLGFVDIDACKKDLQASKFLYQKHDNQLGFAWVLITSAELNVISVHQRIASHVTYTKHVKQNERVLMTSVASLQTNDIKQAEVDVGQALQLFRALKNVNGTANALRVRGRIQLSLGNRKSARSDLEIAHQFFNVTQNIRGDAATLQLLGSLKAQLLDYSGAERDLDEALRKCRELMDFRGEGLCLRALGDLFFMQRKLDSALRYLNLAMPLIDESGSKREKAYMLRSLGEVQVALGDLKTGLANLEAAIPLFMEIKKKYAAEETQSIVELQSKPPASCCIIS